MKAVFVRVGWMVYYAGWRPDDEKPIGGGEYNEENLGHERFNFYDYRGKFFGYAQAKGGPNLQRIDPACDEDYLDDVAVIFVARSVIVGWYHRARVFARRQKPEGELAIQREDCGYYYHTNLADAVLLPPRQRTHEIPQGYDGMGQSNICYVYDNYGEKKRLPWIGEALQFVQAYDGPNLLLTDDAALEEHVVAITEQLGAGQQGFVTDAAMRRAIEDYAMEAATEYYEQQGFHVEPKGKPYDLKCDRKGETIYVEVKGTTGLGNKVFLTSNEVEFAEQHQKTMALFVLHSIEITGTSKDYRPCVGIRRVIFPWNPKALSLKPISYQVTLPLDGSDSAEQ